MKPRAIIFDIDGTLTPILSWLDFTRQLGASVDRHKAIYQDFLDDHITYEQSRVELLGLWQATGRAHRDQIQAIFQAWPLDPAAAPLVAQLHDRNVAVCLITGSIDIYAATIARRLGIQHWYANTEFIFDETGALVSYNYVRDQPAEKLKQFDKFLETTGLSADDCLAVGDGPNDYALFEATTRGILLDPDPNRPQLAGIRNVAWQKAANLTLARDIILASITKESGA